MTLLETTSSPTRLDHAVKVKHRNLIIIMDSTTSCPHISMKFRLMLQLRSLNAILLWS